MHAFALRCAVWRKMNNQIRIQKIFLRGIRGRDDQRVGGGEGFSPRAI